MSATSARSARARCFQGCGRRRRCLPASALGYAKSRMSNQMEVKSGGTLPLVLRRVLTFIQESADTDIGLGDIAAAAQLTPRSVQYIFRRHLGMTPLEYLRRVRLDRAHRDLEAADPAVDTVNAIAGRWGFTHAGRFSVAYKAVFGVAPSVTLRSNWRRPRQDAPVMPSRTSNRR